MLDLETIQKIQNSSIEERIATIEMILNSLKNDIKQNSKLTVSHQTFKVSQYSLGADISVNREEIYQQRYLNL